MLNAIVLSVLRNRFARAAWVLLLAGCASDPAIDRTFSAASQGSRVQFLILHFTWDDWPTSLRVLTEGLVSSHYLVRDDPVKIYRLVDESRRAHHAGASSWRGHTNLNSASIGIEIVNGGNRKTSDGDVRWHPYPEAQIDAVIGLVKAIVQRHGVAPRNILGHNEIAPLRKLDPGPLFPWRRLADEGLIPWPDAHRVTERRAVYEHGLPSAGWVQQKLAEHGFAIAPTGEFDDETRMVMAVFQMRYRPARHDGSLDAETAAILDVMTSAG